MRFFNPFPPGSRSPIAVVAGLGLAGIAILVIALILLVENETYRLAVAIIGAVTAAAGLIAWQLMQIHFNRLERLHKAVLVAQSPHATRVVYGNLDGLEGSKDEVAQLHKVIDTLMRDRVADKEKSNQRLEGVLSSIAEAVLVVTNSGLVSLVNAGAKNLLGADNVAVGTSIYAAVHTSSWEKAVGDIAAQGGVGEIEIKTLGERDLKARMRQLEDKNGVAVVFNAKIEAGAWGIEHDLELHDRPSRPAVIAPELALSDLPCLVLDCETTGLDIANEAIIWVVDFLFLIFLKLLAANHL